MEMNRLAAAPAEIQARPEKGPRVAGPDGSNDAAKKSFQEVWGNIQKSMGETPKKPREAKKQLDKDDFMKIMVYQMRYQDPTKPVDAEKMATQLAQITSVEQLKSINKNIEKMNSSTTDQLSTAGLIGKFVTVDQNRLLHMEGGDESLTFHLPVAARDAAIQIFSSEGELVAERPLGEQSQGPVNFQWDGKLSTGAKAPTGYYSYRVNAFDQQSRPIAIDLKSTKQVIGVSFEGAEPALLVGDAKSSNKVLLTQIIRIEQSPSMPDLTPKIPAQATPKDESALLPTSISDSKMQNVSNVDPNLFNENQFVASPPTARDEKRIEQKGGGAL